MASIDIEKLLDAIRMKESGGNPRAVSPKGAKGAYQFTPETAKEFGLTDPFNEQASREAAKRKMLGLLDEFNGRPELAIAAYNMGQGNLRKNKLDYTRVPETNNYVKGIMGMLGKPIQVADSGHIMSDAPQPGLQPTPQQEQPVPEYDMSGILGAYNQARQRKPEQQAQAQQDTSGFNDPKTMGLLALGLQMMGNSRGQSFGESLASGGMAGLNTMAGVNQGNQEQLQAQQEQQQAQMEQQAQQQQLIQQQAQQEALQSIPPEVLQDPKQLAGIMMKLGMHKEALGMLQQINKPSMGSKKQIIPLEDGTYGVFDPVSGDIQPMDQKSPIYSPTSQYSLSQAKGYGGVAPALQEESGKAKIKTGQAVDEATQVMPIKLQEAQQIGEMKNQQEIDKAKKEKLAGMTYNAEQSAPLLKKAEELLPKTVSGGVGEAINTAAEFFNISTDQSKAKTQLDAIAAELTSKVPRAPGAQSDIELKYAKQQAGDLANSNIPAATRLEAARYLAQRNERILRGEEVAPPDEKTSKLQALRRKHGL